MGPGLFQRTGKRGGEHRTWRALALLLLMAGLRGAGGAELFRAEFDTLPDAPCLTLRPEAAVADGLLRTRAQAAWFRAGLEVGPLTVPECGLRIQYDFQPVKLGAQGQSFVSEAPSTHWYMLYTNPGGTLCLHTRLNTKWEQRGRSPTPLVVGTWYRSAILLKRQAIHVTISQRDTRQVVWDSGPTAMDDIGANALAMLTDEAPTADSAGTNWDNLAVACDDDALARQVRADMERVAAEKQRRLQEQAEAEVAARELRQRHLALIPVPRQIRFNPGEFDLAGARLADAARPGTDAAAVAAVLTERTGLPLPPATVWHRGNVRLRLVASGPWPVARTRPAEGYRLTVTPKEVVIEAENRTGLLWAAQTLAQLAQNGARVPAVDIVDWPAIENRLVMVAVSQGGFQVIDVDYWKRLIRELAAVKINLLMPYFEGGSYYYEKYPFLGIKGKDAFTGEKARLLSEYAISHGIEMLPQQQSLGHAGSMLHFKQLENLRESGDVFCSSKPETFQFLGDLYDELVPAFPHARYIHVGGDEFGHGFAKCPQCQAQAAEIGKDGLYAEHMMHLRQMLAERQRGMMIWWHEQGFTESAADKLAKDITIFDWHYGNQSSYPSLARLRSLGFTQVWATPAVTRYYSSPNDFDATFGNIRGFLTAAAEQGVPGECTCTWVHGIWGGRNLPELNFYALVYSGQCAWRPGNSDEDDFRWRFGRHWFGLSGDGLGDEVLRAWHAPWGRAKEQEALWRDSRAAEPRLAATPEATLADIAKQPELIEQARRLLAECGRTRQVLERWQTTATRNQVTVDFLIHDVHIYETLAHRLLAVDALSRAYAEARQAPAEKRKPMLAPALADLRHLVQDYRQIERMFDRSIVEAGGARCGRGSFAGGEIQFRAPDGRAALEKSIARIEALDPAVSWPEAW